MLRVAQAEDDLPLVAGFETVAGGQLLCVKLEGTVVSFMGETGAGGSARVGADGAYRLVGPTGGETIPAGNYKVVFMPPATGPVSTSDEEMQELMKHNPAEEPPQTGSLIPDKYQNLSTTTAEHEVKEGDNEINIDLVE